MLCAQMSDFCETSVFHFGSDPDSEMLLTVENTGTTTMQLTAVSANADPLDVFFIEGGVPGATVTPSGPTAGVFTIVVEWVTPPTDFEFNVLWSKEMAPGGGAGNWQLIEPGSPLASVPFAATCGQIVSDCTLMAAPCMSCGVGSVQTSIDVAAVGGFGFSNTTPAVFDPSTNMGTLTLPAGSDGVFSGLEVGDFEIPEMVSDICLTADINLITGEFPFNVEFRIERGPDGIFQGGPGLTFNATIDGNGVCSIGGALADGMPVNGFTLDPGTDYSIVLAISNFSGTPLSEDVIVDVSNVSFSYCAPGCSLVAAECMSCDAGFAQTAIDVAAIGGTGFSNTTPAVFDASTNMGTLTLPAGSDGVFSVCF